LFLYCFCFVVAAFICMFCIFMTCSTYYCCHYKLMDPLYVCVCVCMYVCMYRYWVSRLCPSSSILTRRFGDWIRYRPQVGKSVTEHPCQPTNPNKSLWWSFFLWQITFTVRKMEDLN
jgi:hypothetical protein